MARKPFDDPSYLRRQGYNPRGGGRRHDTAKPDEANDPNANPPGTGRPDAEEGVGTAQNQKR